MRRLDGKVAIVTGAGRGIGRGEALLLARQGAAVVVNDLGGNADGTNSDPRPAEGVVEEIVNLGGVATASFDNVASWEGGRALVRQAIDTFGGLDILVCNAGILRDRMVFNMSAADWDAVINVHLKGHFAPTRHATAHWRQKAKQDKAPANGRIVFTSSTAGLYGNAGQANYVAAKAGIAAMAISVARDMARYGVTCNTVCPGSRTRLTEASFGSIFEANGESFDPFDPENIAPWVAYLCTEEAAHISGQTFMVTAGIVELVEGWQPVGHIAKPGRWTVGELIGAQADLFKDRPAGLPERPPMPDLPGFEQVTALRAAKAET